jgi:hypothetical protein
LNTIRAIAHDHGNPIDRYAVLARAATKTAFVNDTSSPKVYRTPLKIYFELALFANKVKRWLSDTMGNLLMWLGLLPDVRKLVDTSQVS